MSGIDVVTGGGGFIGSHLVDRLLLDGRTVRVLDNFSVGNRRNLEQHKGNKKLDIVEGDVRDRAAVDKAVAGAERVFHLAARADIVPSIVEPDDYFTTNVDGTFNLLQAAKKHGAKRFLYVGSSTCYGIPQVYPTPEDAPIRPQYPYALTKYMGEELVMHWGRVYQLPVLSLRFFNVYGPRQDPNSAYAAVIARFMSRIAAGQPVTVYGDGLQTRDFVHVSDTARAVVAAIDAAHPLGGAVANIGTGRAVSVLALARLAGAVLGKPAAIEHQPARDGEVRDSVAATGRALGLIGFRAGVRLEDGLATLFR